jgi:SAM-dependent methyltransferase
MSSDLYDYPALYDALFPVRGHLPYYTELAKTASGDVLELACGTGQLTVPMASEGLPMVGMDLSAPMLSAARERAGSRKVRVEHLEGDMRNFDLGRKFALIFIARNSLLHLHSIEDFLAAFATIRRHLAPGGTFAFDIFNPNIHLLSRPPGQRLPMMEVETETFGKVSVEQTGDYDAATQVGSSRWYVSAPGKPDGWIIDFMLRNVFPQELPLLLSAGGFRLKSRVGDLGQTSFDSNSRFQVCICEAS